MRRIRVPYPGAERLDPDRRHRGGEGDVFGGDELGDVDELVVDIEAGRVAYLTVDVGGFLGLGEKPVRVGLDQMSIMQSEMGDDLRVYIQSTEEQLEQMEAYGG